jgi:hypothetical protein
VPWGGGVRGLSVKKVKIAEVHSITKLSNTFENFIISQLEEELELPKVRPKYIKSYFTKQTITLSKIV